MVKRLTDSIHDLDMGLVLALDRAHNKTVRCLEARLWITEEGRTEDIILSSGESYRPIGSGRVVISSLFGKTRFSLSTQPGWISRVARALRAIWMRRAEKQRPCARRPSCSFD